MDIHLFLQEWNTVEPDRCSFIEGDFWSFHFRQLPDDVAKRKNHDSTGTEEPNTASCDVISLYGVGIIEDLLKESIAHRGWSYTLDFDRAEELFVARVTTREGIHYIGLESLNPGIALLSAYLNSLKNTQAI